MLAELLAAIVENEIRWMKKWPKFRKTKPFYVSFVSVWFARFSMLKHKNIEGDT